MSMNIDKHDLAHDLPEHKDSIHELKMHNAHFARLFKEYHTLTHEIHGIETSDVNVGDDTFEEMKVRRMRLKDELYQMILAHEKQNS